METNTRLGRWLRHLARITALTMATGLTASAWAENGVSASEIVLGQTGAASGSLSKLNEEYLGGAQLYFDDLNARGGILGRKIRLVTLDDGYQPDKALENARQLIDSEGVFALFACFGTGPSLKVLPYANEREVPYFAPYTGADALRTPQFRWAFHVRSSYGQEVEKMVEHVTSIGMTSIAVVHHDDAFGRAGLEAAEKALARRNLKPAVAAAIQADGSNAAAVVAQLAEVNPAAVVMVTAGTSSVALVKAILATDLHAQLMGLSVISSNQLLTALGKSAHGLVVAQVVPSPYSFGKPVVDTYREIAQAAGREISYTGLEGFIAAKTFAIALQRAGNEPTREGLAKAIAAMDRLDTGGFGLRYGADRRVGSDYVNLSMVRNGRFAH